MTEPPRPLLLAVTGNQTLTEKALTLRGHQARAATEPRTQYIHGKAIEHEVNLLGNTIAVAEPDDYREVLEATGIICLISTPSGEPLQIPQKEWDRWIAGMDEERRKQQEEREANQATQDGPPCAVGDHIHVIMGGSRLEGTCLSVGTRYIRFKPLHSPANVIRAPHGRVMRVRDDQSMGLPLGPLRSLRRRNRRRARRKKSEAIS